MLVVSELFNTSRKATKTAIKTLDREFVACVIKFQVKT